MTHSHLTDSVVLHYVEGRLGEAEERAVEQLATGCPECGRALRVEARLQLTLLELARSESAQRRRRRRLAAVAGVAMAAGVAFLVTGRVQAPPARGVDVASQRIAMIESEADSRVRESLIQSALRSGLAVPDGRTLLVPRYESVPLQSMGVSP